MAVGISITEAFQVQMSQVTHASLSSNITPFNRTLQVGGAITRYLDPMTQHGAALLGSMIDQQAEVIAYVDTFKFMMVVAIPAALCLLLMRRPPRYDHTSTRNAEMAALE